MNKCSLQMIFKKACFHVDFANTQIDSRKFWQEETLVNSPQQDFGEKKFGRFISS